jgi:hypothetical protein
MGYTLLPLKARKIKSDEVFDCNNSGAAVLRAAMQAAGVSWGDSWQIGDQGRVSATLSKEIGTKLNAWLDKYRGEAIAMHANPPERKSFFPDIKDPLDADDLEFCRAFASWCLKTGAWKAW